MGGGRRVHFPAAAALVSGRLAPPDPWASVEEVPADELLKAYKKTCLKHDTQPLECLIKQIKEMGHIGGLTRRGTLTLAGCHLTPAACEALEEILRKARFQRIDIHDCNLNDDAAVAFFDMVEYYESTVELDISGNKGLGILAWQACSRMINKCQWLEQLEVRETSLSESTAPVLGRGLRSACSLRCLHLQQSRLSGSPLLCLTGFLKQNKSVRELHLGDNQLVTLDAKHLASMLKSNSTLQLLDVSNNDIQDAGVEAIADALAEQSLALSSSSGSSSESPMSSPQSGYSGSTQERGLAVLVLWNNNLTRNSGNHFSRALSRCRSLEVLNMGQNPLSGETVNRIRSALQQNRSLLSLGMQSTRLGAEAAIALAEVIEDNPVIQRIDLRDNKLQTAGLLALATALKKNQTVTRIDLDDAPPTQTEKEQPLEEARLVKEIRSICIRNEIQQNPTSLSIEDDDSQSLQRKRAVSFTTRKISLTCQTLNTPTEPILSPPKTSSGRFISPLPSPAPSPISSPIPSPSHRSRFQVSRVSDSSSGTSQSPSPSTPPSSRTFLPGTSRFRVVTVQDPPSISVQGPEETQTQPAVSDISPMIDISSQTDNGKIIKCINSRFSIVRNVDLKSNKPDPIELNKIDESSNPKSKDTKCLESNEENNSKEINSITLIKQNIGDLYDEMREICEKTTQLKMKNSNDHLPNTDSCKYKPSNIIKNKSESSLDSPDMEVSRLMEDKGKRNIYDSTSSLDISTSSIESLNNPEVVQKITTVTKDESNHESNASYKPATLADYSMDSQESDVFICGDVRSTRKPHNLSVSSNESSIDLSAPVEVPPGNIFQFSNQSLLNSSVSSNESVSPNIFGKHMKLHGSLTSLEASVSSIDSYKSGIGTFVSPTVHKNNSSIFPTFDHHNFIDSSDSGIFQSENSPKTADSSISSNEETLTSDSILSKMVHALVTPGLDITENVNLSDANLSITKKASSLLDVPSSSKQRSRKISSIIPPITSSLKKEIDEPQLSKTSGLGKFFNLFQNPSSLFSRNVDYSDKKDSNQSASRRESQNVPQVSSGLFWPWSTNITSGNTSIAKTVPVKAVKNNVIPIDNPEKKISAISAEYTVKLFDKKHLQESINCPQIAMNKSDADIVLNSAGKRDSPLLIKQISDVLVCESNISPMNETVIESAHNTGEYKDDSHVLLKSVNDYIFVDDSVKNLNRLSFEHEVLHCDNLGEIEDTCNSSVHLNMTQDDKFNVNIPNINELVSEDKNSVFTSVSDENCDDSNVRMNVELRDDTCTNNVTAFSATYDDSDVIKNYTVQNNLLSVCNTDRGPTGVVSNPYGGDECTNVENVVYSKCDNFDFSVSKISEDRQFSRVDVNVADERLNNSDFEKIIIDYDNVNIYNEINKTVDGKDVDDDFEVRDVRHDANFDENIAENYSREKILSNDRPILNIDLKNNEFSNDALSMIDDLDDNLIATIEIDSDTKESFFNPLFSDSHLIHNENNLISNIIVDLDEFKTENNYETNDKSVIIGPSILLTGNDNVTLIDNYIRKFDDNSENINVIVSDDDNYSLIKSDILFENDTIENIFSIISPYKSDVKNDVGESTDSIKNITDNIPHSSILKQSIGLENKTSPIDRQLSPESGPSIENLPSKIIKKIKENISPENTLTSSMSNTQALAQELNEKRKSSTFGSMLFKESFENNFEINPKLNKNLILSSVKSDYDRNTTEIMEINQRDKENLLVKHSMDHKSNIYIPNFDFKNLDICDNKELNTVDDIPISDCTKFTNMSLSPYEIENNSVTNLCSQSNGVKTSLNSSDDNKDTTDVSVTQDSHENIEKKSDHVDDNRNSDYLYDVDKSEKSVEDVIVFDKKIQEFSCSDVCALDNVIFNSKQHDSDVFVNISFIEEAKDALTTIDPSHNQETVAEKSNSPSEDKQISALEWDDCSIMLSDSLDRTREENVTTSEMSAVTCPALKPSSILKQKKIDMLSSSPKDIPEQKKKFHCSSEDKSFRSCEKIAPVRCGSLPECTAIHSPKSLPDNLSNKSKMKSRSPVNTLGKLARDSLYALNVSDDEIAELSRCERLASLESVRSLGSVSEDAGDTFPLRRGFSSSESRSLGPCTSLESLASMASISETTAENENINLSKNSN